MSGNLIVFEGADEVGKTTLASMLADHLRANGTECDLVGFPGNEVGTLGRHIYELHHDPSDFHVNRIDPVSLQILHIAAHIDAIETRILPALRDSRTVILDRYWWSALIYGGISGAKPESLRLAIKAEMVHWGPVRPSQAFLITRSQPLEANPNLDLWNAIASSYRGLAARERRKYPVALIDNESTPETAFEVLARHI
jgi:dTMP kinase